MKTYRKKESCLVNQYNKYQVGWVEYEDGTNVEITVNGSHTLGENIADTGVVTAYKAYGMNLISEYKLSFISYLIIVDATINYNDSFSFKFRKMVV